MDIEKIILNSHAEPLDFPMLISDHSGCVVNLAAKGYTKLAADHLLNKEMVGHLETVVSGIIRQFNLEFNRFLFEGSAGEFNDEKKILACARIYDTLIHMALNLVGLEKDIIGFSDAESAAAYTKILRTLMELENLERKCFSGEAPIAQAVVKLFLADMKKVMSGFYRPPGSMVAYTAAEIEKNIDWKNIAESFMDSAKEQIQSNIYYKFSKIGMCRFGNDYAIGLRWLRHLGFVQVSTNPVLAAAAYDDDSSLWEGYRGENLCPDFKEVIEKCEEYIKRDPDLYSEEIAAKGTEVSIWPNLVIFRPIAIASNMRYGMVSLQLNPTIADDYEKSLKDALKIYADAEGLLKKYDYYLLWGYSTIFERGRPNIVFKVAGSSPAAIELTRKLESLGIGTNNTVTFTVSQEVELILAKIEGRAEAIRRGIQLTTVYETNMGGRLDDHIREVHAEELLRSALDRVENKEDALRRLAEALGVWCQIKDKESLEEKINFISSRRALSPLNKEPFIDFLAEHGVPYNSRERVAEYLTKIEEAIGYCGILVTKRVYEIFFSPDNRAKWLSYIRSKYGLTNEQAENVLRGIDVLPASKRKPEETILTLASTHMTHTEFPNHQMNVILKSLKEDFDIEKYRESVLAEVDPDILARIFSTRWKKVSEEFVKAYELTTEQNSVLKEVGIVNPEKYGFRGLKPSEWGLFGATVKTMEEFTLGYMNFKKKCIEFVQSLLKS